MNFREAERLLDQGRLEMMRPWGDFVKLRRVDKTRIERHAGQPWLIIQVVMEKEVLGSISEALDRFGQPHLREAKR